MGAARSRVIHREKVGYHVKANMSTYFPSYKVRLKYFEHKFYFSFFFKHILAAQKISMVALHTRSEGKLMALPTVLFMI